MNLNGKNYLLGCLSSDTGIEVILGDYTLSSLNIGVELMHQTMSIGGKIDIDVQLRPKRQTELAYFVPLSPV